MFVKHEFICILLCVSAAITLMTTVFQRLAIIAEVATIIVTGYACYPF